MANAFRFESETTTQIIAVGTDGTPYALLMPVIPGNADTQVDFDIVKTGQTISIDDGKEYRLFARGDGQPARIAVA